MEVEAVLPPRIKGFETGSSPESGIQSNSPELNISDNDSNKSSEQKSPNQSDSSKSDDNENLEENQENSGNSENAETEFHELQNVPSTSGKTKGLLKTPDSPKNNRHIRFACVREYLFSRKQVKNKKKNNFQTCSINFFLKKSVSNKYLSFQKFRIFFKTGNFNHYKKSNTHLSALLSTNTQRSLRVFWIKINHSLKVEIKFTRIKHWLSFSWTWFFE